MFSTRDVPWMKVGTVLDNITGLTAEEASILAGLDFEVLPEPAGYFRDGEWHESPGRFALVRQDTGEVFNYTTDRYHPLPYPEAFSFLDSISPEFVSAGALRNGRQAFMVVRLPGETSIDLELNGVSDPHELYVVLRTSADLTHGVEVILSTLRGKCMNQLTLPSLRRDVKQFWSIRHTATMMDKLAQARKVITSAHKYVESFESIAKRLADIDIDVDTTRKLLPTILTPRGAEPPPKQAEQIDAIIDAMRDDETNGFAGTGWGVVQAVNEYFGWLRPSHRRTDESMFTSWLTGQTHDVTERAAMMLLSRNG